MSKSKKSAKSQSKAKPQNHIKSEALPIEKLGAQDRLAEALKVVEDYTSEASGEPVENFDLAINACHVAAAAVELEFDSVRASFKLPRTANMLKVLARRIAKAQKEAERHASGQVRSATAQVKKEEKQAKAVERAKAVLAAAGVKVAE